MTFLYSTLAFAQAEDVIEAGVDAVFEPLFNIVRPIFFKMSLVFGGLFGLYAIMLVTRVYYEYHKLKVLKAIRFDLDQANKHIGIRYSTQKKGPMQKLIEYWEEISHSRAIKKLGKIKEKKENGTSSSKKYKKNKDKKEEDDLSSHVLKKLDKIK